MPQQARARRAVDPRRDAPDRRSVGHPEAVRQEDGLPGQGPGRQRGRDGTEPRLQRLHGRGVRAGRAADDAAAVPALVLPSAGLPEREHGGGGGRRRHRVQDRGARHLRVRPGRGPDRIVRAPPRQGPALHRAAGGQPEPGLAQEDGPGREAGEQVPHAVRNERDLPLARAGGDHADPVRRNGGGAAGQAGDAAAARRGAGLRKGPDDAADEPEGDEELQEPVEGRGRLRHALARGGGAPLHQAGVPARGDARADLRASQEHGGAGGVRGALRVGLDGDGGAPKDPRGARRGVVAAHPQGAGVFYYVVAEGIRRLFTRWGKGWRGGAPEKPPDRMEARQGLLDLGFGTA